MLPPCHCLLYSSNTIVTLTEETNRSSHSDTKKLDHFTICNIIISPSHITLDVGRHYKTILASGSTDTPLCVGRDGHEKVLALNLKHNLVLAGFEPKFPMETRLRSRWSTTDWDRAHCFLSFSPLPFSVLVRQWPEKTHLHHAMVLLYLSEIIFSTNHFSWWNSYKMLSNIT